MATKITSVVDGRLQFAISAHLTWQCDICHPLFLACVTGKTFCVEFLVIPCFIDLTQGPKGSSLQLEYYSQQRRQYVCAPNDDWTSLRISLYSIILLIGCVSIDLEKDHTFCGFLSTVCRIFVTYDYTKRTLAHPQCGSGVDHWRSCHERGLIEKLLFTN